MNKKFFSTPGKKTVGLIALLVVVLGLGYGGYRKANNDPLLGNLQFVNQQQQQPIELELNPDLLNQGLGENPQFDPGDNVDPQDPNVINMIDPDMIDGLPIEDQSKVSVWLASGQGMEFEGDKITRWNDLSGNERDVIAVSQEEAPSGAKLTGADCSDFNCQYAPYFDGNDDYLRSVKNVDRVQELFVVFDAGDELFEGKNMPVVNFEQTVMHQGKLESLPSDELLAESPNKLRSGINTSYRVQNKTMGVSMSSYSINGCVAGDPPINTNCVSSYSIGKTSEPTPWNEEALQYPILVHFRADAGSNKNQLFINGVEVEGTAFQGQTLTNSNYPALIDEPFFLGAIEVDDPFDRFLNGKIGEVIILNDNISATEQLKVNSYLTTKFGITKGNAYPFKMEASQSTYSFLDEFISLNSNYSHGVVGAAKQTEIGLWAGQGQVPFATSTQRQHFLSMGQVEGLNNGEFIFAGHNLDQTEPENPEDPPLDIFPDQWSEEETQDGFEMLTRKWQIQREGAIDSFVMSAKLTPENELPENLEEVMLVNDEMIVAEPDNETDYAIAIFSTDSHLEDGNVAYYRLLRDDGQLGDLVANDHFYSAKINGNEIASVEKRYMTLVRGPEGSFDPPDPNPIPGPGDDAPPEDPEDPPVIPPSPGNVQPPETSAGDGNVTFDVRAQYTDGNPFNLTNPQYQFHTQANTSTPDTFEWPLDGLNSTKYLNFMEAPGYITPQRVTTKGFTIATQPENVELYLNDENTPFPYNQPLTDADTVIVVANYVPGDDGPEDCEDNEQWNGEECVPTVDEEDSIYFRIETELENGTPLNEGYSYIGNDYIATPDILKRPLNEFGDEPGVLVKTISFQPKEGFVTPGTLVIDDRKISEYPKNVQVFLDGYVQPYPLNDDSAFVEGANIVLIGIYKEAADLTVEMDGPNGFPGGTVEVGDDDAFIPNNDEETFNVDPDEDAEVICPEVDGYDLISDNPIVVSQNDLEAGEETNVACEYEEGDEGGDGETEIIVGLDDAPEGGVVEIPGSNEDEQYIDKDDSEVFTFDEGGEYEIYCPEYDDYILISDNPLVVDVDSGETESVSCEYVPDNGSQPYNPNNPPQFGDEKSCLVYEERDLVFGDLIKGQLGYAAAEVLKNTAFRPSLTNEDVEEAVDRYPLSGFGSNLYGEVGEFAEVRLPANATRMQVTLLSMQLHCLPIFRGHTLPDERLDGKPMPEAIDMPEKGSVAYDVIQTAFFYGILEGYNYRYGPNYTPGIANTIRWNSPITNWQFIKVINNAGQNWQGYQNISDFDLARQYGFGQNDWVFTFVARALREDWPDSAILETPRLLRLLERNITRGEMVNHLFHSVIRRGIYFPEDEEEAWDAYEDILND